MPEKMTANRVRDYIAAFNAKMYEAGFFAQVNLHATKETELTEAELATIGESSYVTRASPMDSTAYRVVHFESHNIFCRHRTPTPEELTAIEAEEARRAKKVEG